MAKTTYTRFVERESTHAVFRKNVQIRLRSASDPAGQARLMSTAIALANLARSFDRVFDHRVETGRGDDILLEFELNFPNRFATAVDEWIAEEAKIHPAILDIVLPVES